MRLDVNTKDVRRAIKEAGSGFTLVDYKPIVWVVLGYILLWYVFLYLQAGYVWWLYFKARAANPKEASLKKIKYGVLPDRLWLDRTVGNLMEQSIPFLVSLLLSALYGGDVKRTATLGWLYIAVRLFYPIAFRTGLGVVVVTIPNYLTIGMLLYSVYKNM